MENKKPFYKAAGRGKMYEQEAPLEQEWEFMKSYYPEEMRYIQSFVEDACDRLDYEGSFIYDECPDKWIMEKNCLDICRRIQESQDMQAMDREHRFMDPWTLREIIGALLLQEIHNRRCRRNRCRNFF